jgi:exonuclease V gamma subunit
VSRLGGERRWVPAPMLPWVRRRLGLPPPKLALPVAAFGMSFLARAQLEALAELASASDVTVYVLDPCEELWDDVAAATRRRRDSDRCRSCCGRPVRDTLASLVGGRAAI